MDAENVVDGGIRHRATQVREALETMHITRPDAPKGFVTRLAEENGWTIERAEAADREYRRFLLLAWATDDMVVPSRDVDAAWHEHLLHTRHYWDATCRDILGKPFHHDPGDGGQADAVMHAEGYRRTLELYEQVFGEPAPANVWPRSCGCEAKALEPAREAVLALPGWTVFAAAGLAAYVLLPGVAGTLTAIVMVILTGVAIVARQQSGLAVERSREEDCRRAKSAAYGGLDMRKATVPASRRTGAASRSSRSDDRSRGSDGDVTMAMLLASEPSHSPAATHHATSTHCDTSTSHSTSTHCDTGSSHSSHSCSGSSSSHSCGGSSSSCGGSSCGGGGCGGS